jgi:hypothetical protein
MTKKIANGGTPEGEMPSGGISAREQSYVFAVAGGKGPAVLAAEQLTQRGQTAHFTVNFDNRLGANGPILAKAVLATCEQDYTRLQEYFGGITPARLPFVINIVPGSNGAVHDSCASTTISCDAFTGTDVDLVRMLVVAEVAEVFMAAQNVGWDCGASNGEGLSRVLSTEQYPAELSPPGTDKTFASASDWLDSNRPDYVNNTDPSDTIYVSIGCSALFLNWLHYQLHFSWKEIILAGAPTLAQTYTNLTGRTAAWASFTTLLQYHFPVGTPSGLTTDNPFPLTTNMLFYEANTGLVNTGRLDSSGTYQPLQSFPAYVGWTHIVKVGMNVLLFYDANTGLVNTGWFDNTSNWQTLQAFHVSAGWTHIVSATMIWPPDSPNRVDILLFYEAKTGLVITARLDFSGTYQTLQSFPAYVGWTHIVKVGMNVLLSYDVNTGLVNTGRLDSSGNWQTVQGFPAYVGWTQIVTDLTLG